ncbi:MAG: DUF1573 domain-containing protein [Planctomycetota bacterium]|nr:DUF1573 domain-containing protein [Planctomycetota bacterium]MDP6942155.1 DUF1573 domain-containing protein [Planctomycetota bacterium]
MLLFACGKPQPTGLSFEAEVQDLGTVLEGKVFPLSYPFQVGSEAIHLTQLQPGCGCLSLQLIWGGSPQSLPCSMPPGAQGEIRVEYSTAGIHGTKNTPVNIHGKGPGLPARLEVKSLVKPWFSADPTPVRLGRVAAEETHQVPVQVTGLEPFKFEKALALPPGFSWEGVPSAQTAAVQEITLTIPSGEPGPHESEFLRLQADNGLIFVLPLVFERVGAVWIRPSRLFPLGVLRPGIETQASLDCGTTEGTLEVLEATVLGIPDSEVDSVTLEGSDSWRIRFTLPSNLPPGPIQGELVLRLRHESQAASRELERRVRLVGLVQGVQEALEPKQ